MTSFSFSRRHTIQMFFCWRSRIACLFISPFKSAHTIEAGGGGSELGEGHEDGQFLFP